MKTDKMFPAMDDTRTLFEKGRQSGITEVVEWVVGAIRVKHVVVVDWQEWQAKKKEWGIS